MTAPTPTKHKYGLNPPVFFTSAGLIVFISLFAVLLPNLAEKTFNTIHQPLLIMLAGIMC